MTEYLIPTEPTEPDLLGSEISQVIAFRKFYRIAFMNGVSDDWEGPLGQATQIALALSETHPDLINQIGYLNERLNRRELQALGIETDETDQSLREAFGLI